MAADNCINELQRLLGSSLSTCPEVLDKHGRDESYHTPAPPEAVAFASSSQEVQGIVRICARYRTPIIPYGAGTSLEGQITAPRGGVCLDLSRMDRIIEVHEADMDAVVEPGVTRQQLNKSLQSSGLFFSVDPGAEATLGGMAATRASGTNTVRYGTMRENVLGLEVVLADGQIIRTGSRARKLATGYDLTHLLVGSEGTLGVIVSLTLRLHALPQATSSAVCPFPDLDGAVKCTIRIIREAVGLARIELLDEVTVAAVNRHAGFDHPEKPTLFFEFHGSESALSEQVAASQQIALEHGGDSFRWATDAEEQRRLWAARYHVHYATRALRPEAEAFTTDVCVPVSALARCILETRKDLAGLSIPAPMVGHVGDGNFHVIFLVDTASPDEMAQVRALNERLVSRALALQGTCSGEHGVGIGKANFMLAEHGEAIDVMRAVKHALDPLDLFNPGKLLPAP